MKVKVLSLLVPALLVAGAAHAAEIYNKELKEPEKAKPLYEKIIFNHQDSIYFVEARKKFRQLRGDTNL